MSVLQILTLIAGIVELVTKLLTAIKEDPKASAAIQEFAARTMDHLTYVKSDVEYVREREEKERQEIQAP